jgi:hypothetical protein
VCIILDANCFGSFRDSENQDMQPIRRWLAQKNGKIAYSDTGKFRDEWKSSGLDITELNRAGRLRLIPKDDVLGKQVEIEEDLESDDPHVIALAIVARIRVLVVQRQPAEPLRGGRRRARGADTALQRDFKRLAHGSVYVTASHKHLLTKDLCT